MFQAGYNIACLVTNLTTLALSIKCTATTVSIVYCIDSKFLTGIEANCIETPESVWLQTKYLFLINVTMLYKMLQHY